LLLPLLFGMVKSQECRIYHVWHHICAPVVFLYTLVRCSFNHVSAALPSFVSIGWILPERYVFTSDCTSLNLFDISQRVP
jgi:hypothetical protein